VQAVVNKANGFTHGTEPFGESLARSLLGTARCWRLLCFSRTLDLEHPLQHHEPPSEPIKERILQRMLMHQGPEFLISTMNQGWHQKNACIKSNRFNTYLIYRLISCRSPVFYVFFILMPDGCRLGSRPLPVVRHASWWLTVRRRGGHNGGERQRGRPRLQWRHLTHPHLALDGQRRPPRPLRSSLFHLRMTDAPLSVKYKSPPPTEASEHPQTSDEAATWMVRHSPQSRSQAAIKPLIN